ncbi:MAG TPA: beta-galactosidase GalB [Opitutaceae bacterium]|nr:beta-galactosidase GalB [Opitutaceae bacterium]
MRLPSLVTVTLSLLLFIPFFVSDASSSSSQRERESFNEGWKFFRGDAPDAKGSLDYKHLKPWVLATSGTDLVNASVAKPVRPEGNPGGNISFVQPNFDDSQWQSVRVPHDWAIEGPFSQDLPGETGKLPWEGVGWYRKTFQLDPTDADKLVALDIDGAMSYSSVWLNGHYVGGWPYGYSSYRLDLTPYLNRDGDNVLAIRLENPPESSRFYPGAGIYRNVWLVKTPPLRLRHWGVFVTTPRVSPESALVQVDVTLENTKPESARVSVTTRIHELGTDDRIVGNPVAVSNTVQIDFDPAKDSAATRSFSVRIPRPKLWDLQHRNRYVAITSIDRGNEIVDEERTAFGVRTIAFDADKGFFLNGKHVPIQGVCMHHDLGALGSAINTRALQRQIEILQSMGCNAIRTSHNPPAPELLDLCDRMGMLVMDEAFDCWQLGKKAADKDATDPYEAFHDYARVFSEWHERDLRALVRRDRNHPSVIMWSIGNEVIEQWSSDGWNLATHLAGIVREEDRTRTTVSALNSPTAPFNGFQTAIDVIGVNYQPKAYGKFHQNTPTIPILSSESASTVSSRGEYFFPLDLNDKSKGRSDFQVSSYDLAAPPWAYPPDAEWAGLDDAPYAAGEFVWTGFDYIGEPTPYNKDSTNLLNFTSDADRVRLEKELKELGRIRVPSRSSYFGIVDLAGFPKDRFYLYQSRWRSDLPMVHILPHWNWPERVNQVTPVHVYSSGDEVELFLNGKSLGRKKRGPRDYRFMWNDVVYQPGELTAVAYKHHRHWAKGSVRTTGEPAQVALAADRADLRADGDDLSFVTVRVADANGMTVPRTHNLVTFTIEGPGEIAAVDNGDATSFESFQASQRKVFNGLALVVIRTKKGTPGLITLKAASEGLTPAQIALHAN